MVTGKFRTKRNRSLVANAKKIYALLQKKSRFNGNGLRDTVEQNTSNMQANWQEKVSKHRITRGEGRKLNSSTRRQCCHRRIHRSRKLSCKPSRPQRKSLLKKQRCAPRTPWITSELAEKLQIAKNKMAEHDPTGQEKYWRAGSQAHKIKRDRVRTNLEQAQNTSQTALWHASRKLKNDSGREKQG